MRVVLHDCPLDSEMKILYIIQFLNVPMPTYALPWKEFESFVHYLERTAHAKGQESTYRLLVAVVLAGYCGAKASIVLTLRWEHLIALYQRRYPPNPVKEKYETYTSLRSYTFQKGADKIYLYPSAKARLLVTGAYQLAVIVSRNCYRKVTDCLPDPILLNLQSGAWTPMRSQYLDRWLKSEFSRFKPGGENINMTTLHKTYARRKYQTMGGSEQSLVELSKELNHSSARYTAKYIALAPS
jgi:integrase